MAASDTSKILLGLPSLPNEEIDKKLWSEFLTIYRAIQNLLLGVSRYTGIDNPDSLTVQTMPPYDYLLEQNASALYLTCTETITRGQMVRMNGAGAARASATAGANQAIGVAEESGTFGTKIRVNTWGLTDSIGGLSAGTMYYLSPTVGAIQNLRPIAAGQIIQSLGWAIDANHLLFHPSSLYIQL